MTVFETLQGAFPVLLPEPPLSDEQIRAVQNPLELPGTIPLSDAIPSYLLFCVKNPDDDSLVIDNTINALAEYGRCKNSENDYLNFKFQCNPRQVAAVRDFLAWCKTQPLFNQEVQIDRALPNWPAA